MRTLTHARFFWALLLLALVGSQPARAITRNVPSQYATIQAAINAASNGDTVLVADGTYTGPSDVDLDFKGKAITVTSVNGAGSTIINCNGSSSTPHRAFNFHSGETSSAIVSGFTIENGYAPIDASNNYNGGAITITNGSPIIANCVFTSNTATSNGGAIYFGSSSNESLTTCTFTSNAASSSGGAVYDASTSNILTVANCTFTSNTANNGNGGAVNCGSVTFAGCSFTSNSASGGGGISTSSGSVSLTQCSINQNHASGGGGINASNSTLTMSVCTINGNTATGSGGAFVLTSGSNSNITNCLIVGNRADYYGGAGYITSSSPTFVNCTITANTVTYYYGGAFYIYGSPTFTNCILYRDTAQTGNEIYLNGGTPAVTYCDIQGGYTGTGNTDADPTFVRNPNLSASPPDFGDLHLQSLSPLIQAGTASGAPATDFDGNTRPNPPSIGAYDVASTDTAAPVTTAALSGTLGSNGYYRSTVQVTLTATDSGGSGVAHTYYKVDGGSYQTYSGAFTVSGDGSHTVTFYSVDNAGNAETAHSVSIAIDTVPPSTTYGVTTGYVTLYPADATSGVAVTYFSLDGSAYAVYPGPQHFYGHHTIKFYSVDNAGNVEAAHTATVNVPEPVPSLTSLSPSSKPAGGSTFTVTVNGMNFTRYTVIKWNGSALTTTFVSASQVTASVPASYIANAGTATVNAVNPAPGGGTSNSLTFTVTSGGPPITTASLSGIVGSNGYYRSAVQVTLSVTDPNGAGYVAATYYKVDGADYQTYSGAFTVSGDGTHTVTFYSVDINGQSETPHSVTFSIDTTPPTTTASVSGATVTLSAADNFSGVAATYYSIDGTAYQAYSGAFTGHRLRVAYRHLLQSGLCGQRGNAQEHHGHHQQPGSGAVQHHAQPAACGCAGLYPHCLRQQVRLQRPD